MTSSSDYLTPEARARMAIDETGGTVPAGFVTEFRDRETRSIRLEQADADIPYDPAELDRRVVAPDQIGTSLCPV